MKPKTFTDRNGSVHTITRDVLGRTITDAVTTLGSGVDGSIRRIETAYDGQGNAFKITSYDAATSGNVVNEVQREFNGLGQMTKEYQEHGGAVNTGTSLKVQYAYSEMSGGANHSRLTSMTYPNAKVLTYNYSSGLNDTISRLSSLSDTTGTVESYDYLGLFTIVKRGHSQPGVDLTFIKQSGESNGDAGDQYIGYDRFDRIADHRWRTSSTDRDRFQYGHDRDGNRLYRDNLLDNNFDELYHANGASNGYDGRNQVTDFRRGALSDTNSDNIPDTVTTASRTQAWDFDALGNFDGVTTDGTGQTRSHNTEGNGDIPGYFAACRFGNCDSPVAMTKCGHAAYCSCCRGRLLLPCSQSWQQPGRSFSRHGGVYQRAADRSGVGPASPQRASRCTIWKRRMDEEHGIRVGAGIKPAAARSAAPNPITTGVRRRSRPFRAVTRDVPISSAGPKSIAWRHGELQMNIRWRWTLIILLLLGCAAILGILSVSIRSRQFVPKGSYFLVRCHDAGKDYYALSLDNRGGFFIYAFQDSQLRAADLDQLVKLLRTCEHGTGLIPIRGPFQSNDPAYSIDELTHAEVQYIKSELEKCGRADIIVYGE